MQHQPFGGDLGPEGRSWTAEKLGQLVSADLDQVERVADDAARSVAPCAEGVGPPVVVAGQGGRSYGEDVEVAVGASLTSGEGAEDDQARRSGTYRGCKVGQAAEDGLAQVGERGNRLGRQVVRRQADQGDWGNVSSLDDPEIDEMTQHDRRLLGADPGQPGDCAHAQLGVVAGEHPEDPALHPWQKSLDRSDVVHQMSIPINLTTRRGPLGLTVVRAARPRSLPEPGQIAGSALATDESGRRCRRDSALQPPTGPSGGGIAEGSPVTSCFPTSVLLRAGVYRLLPNRATDGTVASVTTTPASARLLRQLREDAGRSLRQAANDLGVAPSHLSRLERGEKSPSSELTQRVAGYYGIEEDTVLLHDGKIPDDIVAIIQEHPEVLDELRQRFAGINTEGLKSDG